MISSKKISIKELIALTTFVFVLTFALKILFFNTHIFDPISKGLEDFDFKDLAYSKFGAQHKDIDNQIVIVNIGKADRLKIARSIILINSMKPKLIGFDVILEPKVNHNETDSILKNALFEVNNLVLANRIDPVSHRIVESDSFFIPSNSKRGFVNFYSENVEKPVRYFIPKIPETSNFSFANELYLKSINNDSYIEEFHEIERINYTGDWNSFKVIDLNDLSKIQDVITQIQGKIVLIGYCPSSNDGNTDFEDFHFTPFNKYLSGKSLPDMPGVMIHANILHMLLNGNLIRKIPDFIVYLCSYLLTLFCLNLFSLWYVKHHKFFHLNAKIIQLFFSMILVFIELALLKFFHLEFESGIILLPILLSVDLMYFYDGFAQWLSIKYNFKTIFKH